MEEWAEPLKMVVTIVCSVLASSGFWAYIQKKRESKDTQSKMLIGLGHDRIVNLGAACAGRACLDAGKHF